MKLLAKLMRPFKLLGAIICFFYGWLIVIADYETKEKHRRKSPT